MRGVPRPSNGTGGLFEPDSASADDSSYVRYRTPLTLPELTFERCKVARDLLHLDYKDFMDDLDTNESCPDYIKIAAMQMQNALDLWESVVGAWRGGRR
jgi:hypothetical protein